MDFFPEFFNTSGKNISLVRDSENPVSCCILEDHETSHVMQVYETITNVHAEHKAFTVKTKSLK